MAYFPLFIDLTKKRCVLIGAGQVAARKAQALLAFGALITVIGCTPTPQLRLLAQQNRLTLVVRCYEGAQDLAGAALVIAATDDSALNLHIYQAAQAEGIPVNVVDEPALCSFFFPSLVQRGNLVAGISTSGECPRLAARLRSRLEQDWPQDLGTHLPSLQALRSRLIQQQVDMQSRIAQLDQAIDVVLKD